MEELSPDAPKKKFGIQIIFILYGVASLLGWNALLTKLDFFIYFLEGMKPSTSFSFLNFILNIFFQFLLIIKKDLFPLKFQLLAGIIGSILFLIGIPTSTMLLPKDSVINYIVTGGLVTLMGFINALASGGFFNFVSYFPLDLIVAFSAGQGFSGITMNVLEYLVLFLAPGKEEHLIVLRAWIFFGVSALILVLCLILVLYNYNSEYTRYYLSKGNKSEIPEGSLVDRDTLMNEEEQGIVSEHGNSKEENKNAQKEEGNNNSFKMFFFIFKKIWDLDLLMAYIYIVTFALFPNASIGQNLFNLGDYNSNTVIIIYNIGDTIGRYLVNLMPRTKLVNNIICINRSFLLFTLVFNWYMQDALELDLTLTSIFLILNVAILALTNGIGTTLCFGIAPNEVEDEYKGLAGTSLSFFLIVGIFLGSCINFGVDAIISLFKK
jgi:equilibrative nucleoside transporter 1/2/3